MNRYAFGIQFVCACVLTCAVSAPVAAQDAPLPGGPFAGLFGGNDKNGARSQSLDFRGSLFAAYDSDLLAEAPEGPGGSPLSGLPAQAGMASGLNGSLAYGYRRKGTRAQLQFASTVSLSEFGSGSDTGNLWIPSFGAGTGLSVNLTRKTTLALGASVGYAPFFQYAPFLINTQTVEASPVAADYGYAVNSNWVTSGTGSATVTDQLSKKSSLMAGVVWSDAQSTALQSAGLQSAGAQPGIIPPVGTQGYSTETLGANVRFSHHLTSKLGVHVGYGLQEARLSTQGGSPWIVFHSIDLGVDYGDGLSIALARHVTLAFTVGMGVLTGETGPGAVSPVVVTPGNNNNEAQTTFRVNGSAILSRSIGRTWVASVGYLRGTSYLIGFTQPFNSDSVTAGLSGNLAPRLHFSAAAGYARGSLAFSGPGSDITSLTASSTLTYGLTKRVGLYGQAAYYQYEIPNGFTEIAFPSSLQRRVASVGLTFWLPLINQRAKP